MNSGEHPPGRGTSSPPQEQAIADEGGNGTGQSNGGSPAGPDRADLDHSGLAGRDLTGKDLSSRRNLTERSLGATNLAFATLPEGFKFTSLEAVKELSGRAEKLLFPLLAACAAVIILTHLGRDEDLFRPASGIILPVLQLSVPVRAFYYLTPVLLLILYWSLLSTLLKLWSHLRELPAVLPSDRLLYEEVRAYPNYSVMPFGTYWPGFGKDGDEKHQDALWRATRWERLLITVLVWWLVPLTVAWLWLQYLPAQDLTGSALHSLAIAVAITLSWHSRARMRQRLASGLEWASRPTWRSRLLEPVSTLPRQSQERAGRIMLVLVISGVVALWFTVYVTEFRSTESVCSRELSRVSDERRISVSSLRNDGISWRERFGRGWCGWLGANLQHARLDSAYLHGQSLRRAHLREARLARAHLEDANLEGAQLSDADLSKANLKDAVLTWAVFWETNLSQAKLKEADLRHADLRGANLTGARLQGAKLQGANLQGATLDSAIVCGADLGSSALSPEQLRRVLGGELLLSNGKWRDPNAVALSDSARFLTDPQERREYEEWSLAVADLRKNLLEVLRSRQGMRVHRRTLRDAIERVDVSQGQNTQRRKMKLLHRICSTEDCRSDATYVEYREVGGEIEAFIKRVEEKAINHCVPVDPMLPHLLRPWRIHGTYAETDHQAHSSLSRWMSCRTCEMWSLRSLMIWERRVTPTPIPTNLISVLPTVTAPYENPCPAAS